MSKNEIPEMLLRRLIEAGKANDFSQISSVLTLQEQHDFGYIMRLRPESWFSVAEKLSKEDMVALIKCLTITESIYDDWKAGSVSPVIWLFKNLSSREPELSNNVADWVLANTDNDYLPFGTMNLGAKSLIQFSQFKKLSSERKSARREAESNRQDLAKERKAQESTHALIGAVKRNDFQAVKALLAKGADITAKDSEGLSVLEHAKMKGNEKVLELLKPKGSGE